VIESRPSGSAVNRWADLDEEAVARLRRAFKDTHIELRPTLLGAGVSVDGTALRTMTTLLSDLLENSGLQSALNEIWDHDWTVVEAGRDAAWRPASRVASVVRVLGGVNAAARLLQVAPSQVSRWARGESRPNAVMARRLLDLDHVVAQAQLLWDDDDLVRDWLTTDNQHLGGRPVDLVVTQGSGPVVDAIRAELSGAYA
jgi:uncharacterized protein (DUF2384 family)